MHYTTNSDPSSYEMRKLIEEQRKEREEKRILLEKQREEKKQRRINRKKQQIRDGMSFLKFSLEKLGFTEEEVTELVEEVNQLCAEEMLSDTRSIVLWHLLFENSILLKVFKKHNLDIGRIGHFVMIIPFNDVDPVMVSLRYGSPVRNIFKNAEYNAWLEAKSGNN